MGVKVGVAVDSGVEIGVAVGARVSIGRGVACGRGGVLMQAASPTNMKTSHNHFANFTLRT